MAVLVVRCFLPEITNCDEAWFEGNLFSIAKIVEDIDSFEDENETYRDSTLAVANSEMTILIENHFC